MAGSTAVAPARAADVPQGFFGLGGWSYPDDDHAAKLSDSGLRVLRAALSWNVIEPRRGVRSWYYVDRLADRAQRNGLDLLFVVNGCAAWACGTPWTPPTNEPALSQYRQFVAAAAARYGARGSVWRKGTRPRVMWQIGNEVNGGHYFGKNPQPADYAAFLGAIGSSIKSVDPTATIVASGLIEKPADANGDFLDTFLRELYQQPGYAQSFDVAAVHGYAENPAGTVRVLDTMRRVMLEAGDTSHPLWVTEMGWSTGGPPGTFPVDEATQAAYLRTSWDTMLACRDRWNLQKVMWFGDQDFVPTGDEDGWGGHNGLLRVDGSAKPAYSAFLEYLRPSLPPGRADACALPGGTTLDITDPDTTITASPGVTNDRTGPTVSFTSNEAGARFECSLDGIEDWRACTSPHPVPSSREGAHWLRVRAIDAQGNIDPSPARADWMLDLTPPSTTLTSRAGRNLGFAATDAVGVARFECRLDKRAWLPCTSPYQTPELKAGWHSVGVRAIDLAANVDLTPVTGSFKVDPPKAKPTPKPKPKPTPKPTPKPKPKPKLKPKPKPKSKRKPK